MLYTLNVEERVEERRKNEDGVMLAYDLGESEQDEGQGDDKGIELDVLE